MRLIRCHIENFGKFQNADFDFTAGATVICKSNGWGKSTLAAFLKVMFFGFENERARDDFNNERRRYCPWQGGIYGGSLTFETKGKEYIVTRTFGRKEKEDTFSIRETKTNLESRDFSSEIGEELFSIDESSFRRTVFLSQNDCVTEATDRIHDRIGTFTENTEEHNDYEKVNKRLSDLLNSMSPDRKTGSLYKQKEEIAALSMEVSRGRLLDQQISKGKEQKRILQESYEQLKEEQRVLMLEKKEISRNLKARVLAEQEERLYRFTKQEEEQYHILNDILCEKDMSREEIIEVFAREGCFSSLREEQDSYVLDEEERRRLELLEVYFKDRDPLIESESEPDKKRKNWNLAVLMTGILLFAGGTGWQFIKGMPGAVLAAAGLIVCIFYAFQIKYQEKQWKDKLFYQEYRMLRDKKEDFEKANLSAQWNLIEDIHEELTEKYMRHQKAVKKLPEYRMSIETVDDRLNDIFIKLEGLQLEKAECSHSLEELEEKRQELYEKEEVLLLLKERYNEELLKYQRLKKTRELLGEARASFASRYMEPVKKGFFTYYEMLTGESAGEYELDASLSLTRWEQADQRELRYFSAGYQDLSGLCMRMALLDAMYREEKPFLILDDPFVNLDEENLEGAKRLISHISRNYQVIYFTCHESRIVL